MRKSEQIKLLENLNGQLADQLKRSREETAAVVQRARGASNSYYEQPRTPQILLAAGHAVAKLLDNHAEALAIFSGADISEYQTLVSRAHELFATSHDLDDAALGEALYEEFFH